MRAVLDSNVIISALLSPQGAPARVLLAWYEGRFELVASRMLLGELKRALSYPKLARRIPSDEATAVLTWLKRDATIVSDPDEEPPVRSRDAGDDYLLALAERERAALVSGDRDVLALSGEVPVFSPNSFLDFLERESR